MKRIHIACLVGLTLTTARAQDPDAMDAQLYREEPGPLQISRNGRYLERRDGTPFLWIGDTGWALFHKLGREEVCEYLDNRKAKGFTVVQAVAYWFPHGEDGPGPHNARNYYEHRPFAGSDEQPDTSKPLTLEGGSPEDPNDYWDHADFIVRETKRRGMYLALLPCWGRAFVNATMDKSHATIDEAAARAYGEFLGQRYRNETHIVWVLGGDINPTKGSEDRRQVYREMAQGIGRGVTGRELEWNRPHPGWDRVLMTYHPEGDPQKGSSEFYHGETWLDANGIETWKSVDKVTAAVLRDYGLQNPVKPTLFLEGAYEGGRYPEPGGRITDLKARRQAWQAMLSGAAGHTYGASPIWHFQRKAREGVRTNEWKHAMDNPGARQTAAWMSEILKEHQWWSLIPDPKIVGVSTGELARTAAHTPDGRRILVYLPDAAPAEIHLPKGVYAGTWIRPEDGARRPAKSRDGKVYAPPQEWPDALLSLDSRPRVVVTTDINIMRGDPDDRQSLVHLLFYLDELDVRVVTADRSVERTDPGALRACELAIEAYARDYTNSRTAYRQLGFPPPEEVRKRIYPGDVQGVNAIVEEGRREDARPLHVLAWGTLRVLRDALRAAPEIAPHLRVLSIGTFENPHDPLSRPSWNSAGRNDIYNDPRLRSLWWIENSKQYSLMFHGLTFDKVTGPGETQRIPTGGEPWEFLKELRKYGALGLHLTEVTEGNEWARYFRAGDTPSVLYLLDPAHDPDEPASPSWAGVYERPFAAERPNHWTDATWGLHSFTNPAATRHNEAELQKKRTDAFLKARRDFYGAFLAKLRILYPEAGP